MELAIRRNKLLLAVAAARFAFCTLLALFCDEALAQVVPKQVEPGRLEKQFEEPAEPKSIIEPLVPEIIEPSAAPEAEEIKFVLSGIVIEGATAYDDADFLPYYDAYLNREIAIDVIYSIAEAITAKYRSDGYILSRVIVPLQTIQNGIVRLQVIEGYIDRVIIDGGQQSRRDLIRAYAEKIIASRPLRADDLERYLLLANDLPGVTARAVLRPSAEQPGASNLFLFVEHDPWESFAELDNRGTRFIGAHRGTWESVGNSLLGLYESTRFRAIGTSQIRELRFFEVVHEEQLGAEGTKLTASFGRALSQPGFTLRVLEIETSNTTLSLQLSHPIIRTRSENLALGMSFTLRNSKVLILGDKFSEDRLRVVALRGTYDFVDPLLGIDLLDMEVRQGLDIFNETSSGSANLSRERGRSNFTKLTLYASRLQALDPFWTVFVAAAGQYADSQLLASEEFGIGGVPFGRAFDPSELTGDHGAALAVEFRVRLPYGDDANNFQLYGFYDVGAVWHIDPGVEPSRESAASAGWGLRFALISLIRGSIELAFPLTFSVASRGSDGRESRLFFSLRGAF